MAGGRPPFYETVEELQTAIDKYFESTIKGEYTITGLALALGFSERKSLIDYSEKPEFVHAIKESKLRIEQDYEQSLRKNGRAGDIFGLKNFGWEDKSSIDNSFKGSITQKIERHVIDVKNTDSPNIPPTTETV